MSLLACCERTVKFLVGSDAKLEVSGNKALISTKGKVGCYIVTIDRAALSAGALLLALLVNAVALQVFLAVIGGLGMYSSFTRYESKSLADVAFTGSEIKEGGKKFFNSLGQKWDNFWNKTETPK